MYDCEVSKKLQAILKNHPHLDALAAHIDLSSPETSLLASGMMAPDGSYTAAPLVPNLNSSSAKGKVSAKPIDIGFDLPYVPLYWFEHMLQYSLDEHLTPQQQAQLNAQVQQQIGGLGVPGVSQGGYRTQPSLPPLYGASPGARAVSPRLQPQQHVQQQYYRGTRPQYNQAAAGAYGSGYYGYDLYGHPQQHQQPSMPMQGAQPHLIPTFYDPLTGNYYLQPATGGALMPQQHQPSLSQQDLYYYGGDGIVDSLVGSDDPLNYYDDFAIQPPPLQQQHQQRYGVQYPGGMPPTPPPSSSSSQLLTPPLSSLEISRSAETTAAAAVETSPTATAPSASINVSLQDTNLLSEEQLSVVTGLTATAPVFKMKTPFPLPGGSGSSAVPTANSSTSTSPVPSLPGAGGITPPSVMYGSDFSFSVAGGAGTVTAANLNNVSASAMLLFSGGGSGGGNAGGVALGNRNRTVSSSSNTSVASSITTTSISNPTSAPPALSGVSVAAAAVAASTPMPPLMVRSVSDTSYTRLLHANNSTVVAAGAGSTSADIGELLMNKSYFSSSSLMSLDSAAANAVGGNPLLFSGGTSGLGGWSGSVPTSSRILSTLNAGNANLSAVNNANTSSGSATLNGANSSNSATVGASDLLPEFDLALDFGSSPTVGGVNNNKSPSNGDRSPFSLAVGSNSSGLDGTKIRTSSDFTDRSRLNSNNSVDVAELLVSGGSGSDGNSVVGSGSKQTQQSPPLSVTTSQLVESEQ